MIDAEKADYPIIWMCKLLGVPRSSFYAWRNRVETPTAPAAAARRRDSAGVHRIASDVRLPAGRCQLNREGHQCSIGLVADLMRERSACKRCSRAPTSAPRSLVWRWSPHRI